MLVLVLAVVCGITVWGGSGKTDQLTVVISVDGEEVERCALADFPDADQQYSNNVYTLSVVPVSQSNGRLGLKVESSDCPTQDCVHTGTITRSGQSIVCLPARTIITLEGGAAESGGPDVVIG